jgi:hypothetical protein
LEQLNFGIRFFFPDVCIRDGIGEPTTLYVAWQRLGSFFGAMDAGTTQLGIFDR